MAQVQVHLYQCLSCVSLPIPFTFCLMQIFKPTIALNTLWLHCRELWVLMFISKKFETQASTSWTRSRRPSLAVDVHARMAQRLSHRPVTGRPQPIINLSSMSICSLSRIIFSSTRDAIMPKATQLRPIDIFFYGPLPPLPSKISLINLGDRN